jgi:hypothetical protein
VPESVRHSAQSSVQLQAADKARQSVRQSAQVQAQGRLFYKDATTSNSVKVQNFRLRHLLRQMSEVVKS